MENKKSKSLLRVRIRNGKRKDVARIYSLEEECFEDFLSGQMINKWVVSNRKYCSRLATLNGEIVGYTLFEKISYGINLLRLGVDERVRERRIGSQLIRDLKNILEKEEREKMVANSKESNTLYQMFLSSNNFSYQSKGNGENPEEDNYFFEFNINDFPDWEMQKNELKRPSFREFLKIVKGQVYRR